jgi:hypothetical protein
VSTRDHFSSATEHLVSTRVSAVSIECNLRGQRS